VNLGVFVGLWGKEGGMDVYGYLGGITSDGWVVNASRPVCALTDVLR
jgi:hypothetical protein